MFRVLIAEDELPLLRGIKRMIEVLDPDFSVVFCAANGQEALDYLTQHTVDVVFTDINMPLMDGLELLSQLSDRDDLRTVVISGYDSFSYAQKAIRFGTRSYLLKPIDRNELAELLWQFKTELSVRPYTEKRERLLSLLFGGTQDQTAFRWGDLSLYYLCAGPFRRLPSPEELPEAAFWEEGAFLSYLKQKVRQNGGGDVWLFWGRNSNEALIVLEDSMDFSAGDLIGFLEERAGESAFFTVAAGPAHCEEAGLMNVMNRLRTGISRHAVFGRNTLLLWEKENQESGGITLPDLYRSQLSVFTQRQQVDNLLHMLGRIKEYFKESGITQYRLEEELSRVILLIQGDGADQWIEIQHVVQDMVGAAAGYDSLFDEVKIVCQDFLRGQPFDTSDKEVLMRSVDEYIRENVSKSFTTNELAKHFGLVAPYLSKLFKRYKGMSPTQYVQSMRMERAKQILTEYPDLLVKDIAEQLGYTNALYFSKVFQKALGMYPSEYRAVYEKEALINERGKI